MTAEFKVWQCRTCGYLYDESEGDPLEGLAPGTRWEDVPEDWICPMCGTPKSEAVSLWLPISFSMSPWRPDPKIAMAP